MSLLVERFNLCLLLPVFEQTFDGFGSCFFMNIYYIIEQTTSTWILTQLLLFVLLTKLPIAIGNWYQFKWSNCCGKILVSGHSIPSLCGWLIVEPPQKRLAPVQTTRGPRSDRHQTLFLSLLPPPRMFEGGQFGWGSYFLVFMRCSPSPSLGVNREWWLIVECHYYWYCRWKKVKLTNKHKF